MRRQGRKRAEHRDEPYPLDMQWDLVYMDIKNPKAHDLMDTFYPNELEHSAAKLSRSLPKTLQFKPVKAS